MIDIRLSQGAVMLGALWGVAGLAAIAAPGPLRRALERFPRNVSAGRLLAAIALGWVAAIVHGAALGRFTFLKPWIFAAAPAVWVAVIVFMDELLAPRALGGLLLLAAQPLLLAARLHPAPAGRAVSLLAYAGVVAGMTFVAAPWHFRRIAAWTARSPRRLRVAGLAALAVGAALAVLGRTVFA